MKKFIALVLLMALSFTSLPLAYADFANGTLVQTETGFKPIEQIRVGDLVYAKDETTGKTEYHRVIQLFQGQADKTYHITVNGIPITTTGEHPFWVHGQGWLEARHLKAGDLLQSPEGTHYPIDRIEIKNNSASTYNFGVEGVHNYFVTESEIWTHNFVAPIERAIVQVFAKNAAKSAAKNVVQNSGKSVGKASKGSISKGLSNPFKGKTFREIDDMFMKKRFERRGNDPLNGRGGYVNPTTGRSYYLDRGGYYKRGYEPPHVDVNRLKNNKSGLPKKKYFLGE
ncbi:polymorphic toxin-type HINT domain-containing protein [Paenibacillus popilliae]|uniref:Hint domain-containing protein n=1 Tax=Paenibacillus popilliae ATCC 14706 TaxID=1212764 RepID=M9M499_PAEPP|nr:polymorphic toxin-type HINT domain-containing protein [Paenibacillus popilliae]GAC42103.1 hypothetical protein PPOP_1460 [Paenibacillus popilliae ATCC 14706]